MNTHSYLRQAEQWTDCTLIRYLDKTILWAEFLKLKPILRYIRVLVWLQCLVFVVIDSFHIRNKDGSHAYDTVASKTNLKSDQSPV
jgi:hypothetical protein